MILACSEVLYNGASRSRALSEYQWEARTRAGEIRRGVLTADDEASALQRLRAQHLQDITLRRQRDWTQIQIGSGVSAAEKVTFTRLFATMIDAGLPIVQSLEILQAQSKNKSFSSVLRDVKSAVEGGATLSDSLKRHPKVFDSLYVHLVHAGEIGGILDTILLRLAAYQEKNIKLSRQVRGAMVYPVSILLVFVGVLGVMLGWVIPSFQQVFSDLGAQRELPFLTTIVITISEFFVGHLPLIALLSIAALLALGYAYRTPRGKRVAHGALLQAPIIGELVRKIAVARFTRTMGTLLSSGVPLLDALDVVAHAAGNVIIEEALLVCKKRISEGQNMADPLMDTNVFPLMVTQMISVGEQTGKLDHMQTKIADFYDDEVDVAVASMTKLIEPVMMIVIGVTVGVMLIAMYLPIFSMVGAVQGG